MESPWQDSRYLAGMDPSSSTVFEELQLAEALRRSMDPECQVALPTTCEELQRTIDQPEMPGVPHVTPSAMVFNDGFLDCSIGPNTVVGAAKWVVTADGRRQEQIVEVHTDERGHVQERHVYERSSRGSDHLPGSQQLQGNMPAATLLENIDQEGRKLDQCMQAANHEAGNASYKSLDLSHLAQPANHDVGDTEWKQPDLKHLPQAEPIAVPFSMTCVLSPPQGLQSVLQAGQATLASLPTSPAPVAALLQPPLPLTAQQTTARPSGFNPQHTGQSPETTWGPLADCITAWAPPPPALMQRAQTRAAKESCPIRSASTAFPKRHTEVPIQRAQTRATKENCPMRSESTAFSRHPKEADNLPARPRVAAAHAAHNERGSSTTACWPAQPVPAGAVAAAQTATLPVAMQGPLQPVPLQPGQATAAVPAVLAHRSFPMSVEERPLNVARTPTASPSRRQTAVRGSGARDVYKADIAHGLQYGCTSCAAATNQYPKPIAAGAVAARGVQHSYMNSEWPGGSSQGPRPVGPGNALVDPQRPEATQGAPQGVGNCGLSSPTAQKPRPSGSEPLSIFTRPD